jgi:hypothetical protein
VGDGSRPALLLSTGIAADPADLGMSALPFHTLIIHSMPRTGSTSVARFLRSALADYPVTIQQIHFASRDGSADWNRLKADAPPNDPGVGVVSICREPVARNLSHYWKFIHPYKPAWADDAAFFYAANDHLLQARWWECELQTAWDMDIFLYSKFRPPFMIIEKNRLLLLRTEDMTCLPEAVSKWLGIDVRSAQVPHANADGHGPPQRPWLALTMEYLHAMYGSDANQVRYREWFYSTREIVAFQSRWLAKINGRGD